MNYACLKALFQKYALQPSTGVASFSMSDDERTLSLQKSTTNYPQLQLDRPQIRPEIIQGGSHAKYYSTTVAILSPAANDDWALQEEILESHEGLMDDLIAYLDYQKKRGWANMEIQSAFPIKMWEVDGLWGWGLQFEIKAKTSYCHDTYQEVDIVILSPVWTSSETELHISVDANPYSETWDEERYVSRSLKALASSINEDTSTHGVTAIQDLNTLILVGSSPGDITYTPGPTGHTWEEVNCGN